MNGSEIILLLFVIRIVIPFGFLLLIGEAVRRHNARYWLRS
jgi:hypothetical protein